MSIESSYPLSENAQSFLDAHSFHAHSLPHEIAVAEVHVPLLARQDGKGPNSPILDGTNNPELRPFVENRRLHAAALGVLIMRNDGSITVSLSPVEDAHIRDRRGKQVPINYFGKPVSATSDFGEPMENREWRHEFSSLLAHFESPDDPGRLFGIAQDSVLEIGGIQNGRSDADRLARPVLVFGKTRGLSTPPTTRVDFSALERVSQLTRV